jgi:hypothetical protein
VELTNRHKLLLGVVGVGVAAVAVDRFVLSDSAPSAATAATAVHADPAPLPQSAPAAPAQDGSADRLQRLAEALPGPTPENETTVAGAMTAPLNWLPDTQRKAAEQQPGRASRGDELVERFHLTSVFTVGPGYATISGEKIAVGGSSEKLGIKLLAIVPPAHRTPAAAIVEYRGQEVRLSTGYAKLQHSESPQK